jgi:hypothetical protein
VSPDIAATVDCSGATSVPAASSIVCTYSVALPDGTDRLNTATASQQLFDFDKALNPTADGTADYSGTANVAFGDPSELVDECIDVTDTNVGFLGTVCVDDAPKTFEYSLAIGPFSASDCGTNELPNTASFESNDGGDSGESTVTIIVEIPCPQGCTLTQGYWKTHSTKGPAGPADPTWLAEDLDGDGVIEGPDEDFFGTGDSWYEVFWTPSKGNFSYNLAHQYMAAYLNTLNGAAVPAEVQTALDGAEVWFTDEGLKRPSKDEKSILQGYHSTLAAYNEGAIGPGHCDEDPIARANNTDE